MKNLSISIRSCFFILFLFAFSSIFAQQKSEPIIYTVKPGDYLLKIAVEYGNPNFWEPIYKANMNKIKNPDLIYVGQKLTIPTSVVDSDRFVAKADATSTSSEKTLTSKKEMLEKFRKAFERVVDQQQTKKEKVTAVENSKKDTRYQGLEFGGLS